jgi:hypothetical protein
MADPAVAEGTLTGLASPAHGYRLWLVEVDAVLIELRRLAGRRRLEPLARQLEAELEHARERAAARAMPRKSFPFAPPGPAAELLELALLAVRAEASRVPRIRPRPPTHPEPSA